MKRTKKLKKKTKTKTNQDKKKRRKKKLATEKDCVKKDFSLLRR